MWLLRVSLALCTTLRGHSVRPQLSPSSPSSGRRFNDEWDHQSARQQSIIADPHLTKQTRRFCAFCRPRTVNVAHPVRVASQLSVCSATERQGERAQATIIAVQAEKHLAPWVGGQDLYIVRPATRNIVLSRFVAGAWLPRTSTSCHSGSAREPWTSRVQSVQPAGASTDCTPPTYEQRPASVLH